jgi:hypothetical protein
MRRILLFVVTTGAFVPTVGRAQAPAASSPETNNQQPTTDNRDDAAALFDQGMALFNDENWSGALEAFERAYALEPHYVVLFNIGACRKALHDYPSAVDAFEAYLREGGDQVPAERRVEAEQMLAEARSLIAAVTVVVDRDGAEVTVDGVARGVSPLAEPLRLGAGNHVIGARAQGTAPAEERVALVGGETRTVNLVLGSDSIGGTTNEGTVDQAWFWTAVGITGALAIGGAVTGAMTLVEKDAFEDAVTRCQGGDLGACDEGNDVADRHDAYRLATNVLLPAAGAVAVTAVVLFFFTEFGDGEAPPATIGLDAGPRTFGMSAAFAF